MILVLNCVKDEGIAESFNHAILRPIKKIGETADLVRVPNIEKILDLSKYLHVIISGSEASVVDDNPWDETLVEIIREIVRIKKPLLGICYGHQFIVRALSGKACARKSKTPEFGWGEIQILENQNPLFKNIVTPICMLSHFDEVCDLDDRYTVLASTAGCAVHAYRYENLPVWGVQFHPEYNEKEADEIFEIVLKDDSSNKKYFKNDLENKKRTVLNQNEQIIINFLKEDS